MQYTQYSISETFNIADVPSKKMMIGFSDTQNPFIPSKHNHYVFRKEFLREVLAFLKEPFGDALFVTGPTGSGKTSGITEIAARLNWPVQQITAHGNLELADLIGYHALISEELNQTPVMKFMYGPLSVAMKEGHILLINEIDLMDPSELSGLNDVLEGRPLVIPQNGGEVIKPHTMFRVIVTGNSTGTGDTSGLYQGVLMQNIATMDRYRFTKVSYADEKAEANILNAMVPRLPENIRTGMIRVANEIRNLFLGESGDGQDGQISCTMSTRTLIRWAKLTLVFRGAPNAIEYALEQAFLTHVVRDETQAILRITKDIFGDQFTSSH